MLILRKAFLWLAPVLWVSGLELVKKNQAYLWPTVILLWLYIFLVCFIVCRGQLNKNFFYFLILPFFFGAASFLFLLFLVSPAVFHLIAILSSLCLYLLLKQYFIYFYFPSRYQPYSLESLSFYLSLLLFYFLFVSVFAGLTLLKLDRLATLSALVMIIGLVLFHFFWIHKIGPDDAWIFVVSIELILLELALGLSYLPTGYYVNAFILTDCAYLMLGLSRSHLQNILNKKTVVSYVSVSAGLALLAMLTAKWS